MAVANTGWTDSVDDGFKRNILPCKRIEHVSADLGEKGRRRHPLVDENA